MPSNDGEFIIENTKTDLSQRLKKQENIDLIYSLS